MLSNQQSINAQSMNSKIEYLIQAIPSKRRLLNRIFQTNLITFT